MIPRPSEEARMRRGAIGVLVCVVLYAIVWGAG